MSTEMNSPMMPVRDVASWGSREPRHLADLSADFIRTRRAAGCSSRTLQVYEFWLVRLRAKVGDDVSSLDAAAATQFLADLRERGLSSSTVHQAYRTLKTFVRWLMASGATSHNPTAGLRLKVPVALPQVPTAEEVVTVLDCCSETFAGRRNAALILVMADSAVRSEELRRLRIEHLDPKTGKIVVRGKGAKDRVVFVSPGTLEAIRSYLEARPGVGGSDSLFVDAKDRPLTSRHLVQILHRLSACAGLPPQRRLHPHALRHWAATSWIRRGMGLDEVRRLLGHSTLSTTLRYLSLVPEDLQRAHRDAAVIESLGLLPGRKRPLHPRAPAGRISAR